MWLWFFKISPIAGIRLQWNSNRSPRIRRSSSVTGRSARKHLPVVNKGRASQTRPAQGPRFLMHHKGVFNDVNVTFI